MRYLSLPYLLLIIMLCASCSDIYESRSDQNSTSKTLRVGRKISGIPEYPSNGADNSSLPVNSKMLDGSLQIDEFRVAWEGDVFDMNNISIENEYGSFGQRYLQIQQSLIGGGPDRQIDNVGIWMETQKIVKTNTNKIELKDNSNSVLHEEQIADEMVVVHNNVFNQIRDYGTTDVTGYDFSPNYLSSLTTEEIIQQFENVGFTVEVAGPDELYLSNQIGKIGGLTNLTLRQTFNLQSYEGARLEIFHNGQLIHDVSKFGQNNEIEFLGYTTKDYNDPGKGMTGYQSIIAQ